jgi:hypothetical protein
MSLETVAEALAAIAGGATGVTKAYGLDDVPSRLDATYLPTVVVWPGAGTYVRQGARVVSLSRAWRVLLFIAPRENPAEMKRQAALAQPVFEALKDVLLAHETLHGVTGVESAFLTGDTGLTAIEDFGLTYVGAEFTVTVVEVMGVTYQDG